MHESREEVGRGAAQRRSDLRWSVQRTRKSIVRRASMSGAIKNSTLGFQARRNRTHDPGPPRVHRREDASLDPTLVNSTK